MTAFTLRTPEDKLRWAFRMYDEDNSRMIDIKEMVNVMKVIFYYYIIFSYRKALEKNMVGVKIFKNLDSDTNKSPPPPLQLPTTFTLIPRPH